MPLMLGELRDDAQSFANTISKAMNVDVLVVDNNFKEVCSTVRHYKSYEHITENTMIGSVISSRKVVAVEDRRAAGACQDCPDRETCEMNGFIGVPIFYDGFVMGAIALILPHKGMSPLFSDINVVVEFVESMADLLASKLRSYEYIKVLDSMKREREMLIDSIKDGYVVTDHLGYITYHNKQFSYFFAQSKSCTGMQLKDILPHSRVIELIERPMEIKSQLIYHRSGGDAFYGFLACNQIYHDGLETGVAFRFRPLSQERSNLLYGPQIEPGVSFAWLGRGFFSEQLVHAAKKLAVTSKNVLISGEEGTGKKLLAQCIHNYSNRSDKYMVTVECHRVYREHLPKSIFGILGKLQSAHESTVLFSDVERMPISFQLELVDFLKWPALRHHDGPDMVVDVRFLFTTTCDLAKLVQQKQFSEELYYRISEHQLLTPTVRDNPGLLDYQIRSTLEYYKSTYGKYGLEVERAAHQALVEYHWPGNLLEVEAICDALVFNAAGKVSLEDVQSYLPENNVGAQEVQTISQVEKQMIADLLQSGLNKEKIAQMMGISRATLYRKIKIYKL